MSQPVDIYAVGLVNLSCCASGNLSRELVEEHVNRQHPTGLDKGRWEVAEEGEFAEGTPMPCPCPGRPDERRHWLLHC